MKKAWLIILLLIHFLPMRGQDPQFSQYYSAPLLLNPAFTGAVDCYRAGVNARTQWVGLNRPFTTGAVFLDMSYPSLRSGFGLMVSHDNSGLPRLRTNEVSGFYSYLVPLSEELTLRLGLEGSYVSRRIDYSPLVFEDQYKRTTLTRSQTGDPVTDHRYVDYFDLGSGMLLYGDRFWLGLSGNHLNRPDESFGGGVSRLPVMYSVHGGYSFALEQTDRGLQSETPEPARLIPTFHYKGQAGFDQLDVGVYYVEYPVLVGAWYRGLLIRETKGVVNQDAVNVQVGYRKDKMSFIYSYDYTISRLEQRSTHGAHEISVIYRFCWDWPPRKDAGPEQRKLPCPDLDKIDF